ncbi:MAG: hypothetical protein ACTS8H_03330 [Arsenophonus sp. NC-PE1-MAG3]
MISNIETIIDVLDENLVLINKEMTSELLAQLECKKFNEINEKLIEMIEKV